MIRKPLLAVAALAVCLRLVHLLAVSSTPILSYHESFRESDMYMFDRWGQTIASGDFLGRQAYHPLNGWQLESAPVEKWKAWYGNPAVFYKAPGYAYLIGGLHAVARDVIVPLALLQILAAGASTVLLGTITTRLFGAAAGLAASLVYAVYAPDIHFGVVMLRGPWIVLVALAGTWLLGELRRRPATGRALALGATVGLAIAVNEAFLTVPLLVAVLLAAWLGISRRLARVGGAFAIGLAAALAPLAVRNLVVGAPALKFAVTGSTVYAVFNAAGSSPYFFQVQPAAFIPILEASDGELLATVLGCLRSFGGVREVAVFYLQKALGLTIPFENPDNANFYYAAARSPLLALLPGYALVFPAGVVGLVLTARRWREWTPLLPFALALLVSILAALPLSRYRATLTVFLIVFAGVAIAEAVAAFRARRLRALGAIVLGSAVVFAAGAVVQDRVVFAGVPRAVYYYRPAEFLLGATTYERQGQLAEASEEALSLTRLNPHPGARALGLLAVGRLEALRGRGASATQALSAARQLDPGNPALLQGVGDVYWRVIGDRGAALECYRSALQLTPPDGIRLALENRLRALEPATAVK